MKRKLHADCALCQSTVCLWVFCTSRGPTCCLASSIFISCFRYPFLLDHPCICACIGRNSIWKICLKCIKRGSESFSAADGLVAFKLFDPIRLNPITEFILAALVLSFSTFWDCGIWVCVSFPQWGIPTEHHLPKARCHIGFDHSASAHGSQNGNHWSNAESFVFLGRFHLVTVSGSSEWFLIKNDPPSYLTCSIGKGLINKRTEVIIEADIDQRMLDQWWSAVLILMVVVDEVKWLSELVQTCTQQDFHRADGVLLSC